MRRAFLVVAVIAGTAGACRKGAEAEGPAAAPVPVEEAGFACMGTTGTIKVRGGELPEAWRDELELFEELETIFSHWQPGSALSKFNQSESSEPLAVPVQLADIVAQSQAFTRRSDGAFDITVAPLVELWGFGAAGPKPAPAQSAIDATRRPVGSQWLSVDLQGNTIAKLESGAQIDLSAIAKGYAIDRVAESLEQLGVDDYLIEFGGELRAGPAGPWTVGIEGPTRAPTRSLRMRLALQGEAIATSGTYRLNRDGATHLIDPRTGRPVPGDLVAASVRATTATEADAMATALMVMGREAAERYCTEFRLAASLVYADGGTWDSPSFASGPGSG